MNIFLIILGLSIAGFGISLHLKPGHIPSQEPQTNIGEVTDLIKRLRPLVTEPDSAFLYSNGLNIIFLGNGNVQVKLKFSNQNELNAIGKGLPEAVSRLSAPNLAIQDALKGWRVQTAIENLKATP